MRNAIRLLAAAAMLGLSSACSNWSGGPPEDQAPSLPQAELQEQIISVQERESDIFSSTSKGIYRANKKDRKWVKLPAPQGCPPWGGMLAVNPHAPDKIYYFKSLLPPHYSPDAVGIWLSENNGNSWTLLSLGSNINHLFFHPDGSIYAVFTLVNQETRSFQDHAFMSLDGGRTWHDINLRAATIGLIFIDPDNPNRVCMTPCGIRDYIAQAVDKSFKKWNEKHTWEWDASNSGRLSEFFFESNSAWWHNRSYLAEEHVSLGSYFDKPSRDVVKIRSVQLYPSQERFKFKRAEKVSVEVEVRLLGKIQKPAMLPDLGGSLELWQVKIATPSGKTMRLNAPNNEAKQPQENLRASPDFALHEIDYGKPYKRSLELWKLYDFPEKGVYKVQVIYTCRLSEKGELSGSLTSLPFEVEIE